jgi:hypothetical protein
LAPVLTGLNATLIAHVAPGTSDPLQPLPVITNSLELTPTVRVPVATTPGLVTTKDTGEDCAPTKTTPKSVEGGEIASTGGAVPAPVN